MLKSVLLSPERVYSRISDESSSTAEACNTMVPTGKSSSSDTLYGVPTKLGVSFSSETVTLKEELA